MKQINSKYIFQIIFSFINQKRKLKISKYNKILQNKLDLNINFYKKFSGRYIIYDGKGIGKEYNNDLLLFEGEYLNGERTKGKEYDFYGNVIFDGEFLNGQRTKGKEFNRILASKGESLNLKRREFNVFFKFEGEFSNGIRKNGKEYYKNGKVIYEGDYLDGEKWNGKGKKYEDDNFIFEGEFLNGKQWNGIGKEYYIFDKVSFEGEYKNGKKWNGKGYDIDGNISYELKEGKGLVK